MGKFFHDNQTREHLQQRKTRPRTTDNAVRRAKSELESSRERAYKAYVRGLAAAQWQGREGKRETAWTEAKRLQVSNRDRVNFIAGYLAGMNN